MGVRVPQYHPPIGYAYDVIHAFIALCRESYVRLTLYTHVLVLLMLRHAQISYNTKTLECYTEVHDKFSPSLTNDRSVADYVYVLHVHC